MFFATLFSMLLNGTVVPRSSATVVPAASAAATAAGAAAGAVTGEGAAAGGAAPFELAGGATPAARSTSPAVMRPFGPVPPMVFRSTLSFLATCFAYGVAMTRPSARGAGPAGGGGGGGGGGGAAAGAGAAASATAGAAS